jgi:hypothetical protein
VVVVVDNITIIIILIISLIFVIVIAAAAIVIQSQNVNRAIIKDFQLEHLRFYEFFYYVLVFQIFNTILAYIPLTD